MRDADGYTGRDRSPTFGDCLFPQLNALVSAAPATSPNANPCAQGCI